MESSNLRPQTIFGTKLSPEAFVERARGGDISDVHWGMYVAVVDNK